MGLDMYLTAKKNLSAYNENDLCKINAVNMALGFDAVSSSSPDIAVNEVSISVAYWRKANAVHAWFVEACQAGVDDCREYEVTRQQLQYLVDLCNTIIGDASFANELLPPVGGFFFGGTATDEWYFESLEQTSERLSFLLKSDSLDGYTFFYQSSW